MLHCSCFLLYEFHDNVPSRSLIPTGSHVVVQMDDRGRQVYFFSCHSVSLHIFSFVRYRMKSISF